jgi:hypothetical protein
VHELCGEVLEPAAAIPAVAKQRPLHAGLEPLLERRDDQPRSNGHHHGPEAQQKWILRGRRRPDERHTERTGHESGQAREREAKRFSDHIVDVDDPMARDRVGNDLAPKHGAEAPKREDVEAMNGEDVGDDERNQDRIGEEVEFDLDALM